MNLWQDIRFGARMLMRNRAFTLIAAAALGLGIGVNTTAFTLVNAVLFRGLPFADQDRIMHFGCTNTARNQQRLGISYPDFKDWRAQAKSFQGLAAFSFATVNLSDRTSPPERYSGNLMTANSFAVLGQKPLLGRDFAPADDQPGAPPVAILGYAIWKDRYGGDPGVLGRVVRINEVPTVVIGVMPEGMRFPLNTGLWLPLIETPDRARRDARGMNAFGRLAPGVSLTQARSEMDLLAARLTKEHPKTNQGIGIALKPYNDEFNGNEIRVLFLALLGAVGFVLLIACANVANLLLARSISRTREISIRSALGASRWRIVRQLLGESLLLGILGGVVGYLLSLWGVSLFDLAVANVGKPYWIKFTMDFTVFSYLAAICLGTSILFGLAPALQVSKLDLNRTLKEGGRGTSGGSHARYLSGFLVVTELALALVLLAGAGLMIRSFLNMYNRSSGVDAANVITMRLNLADAKYPKVADRFAFYERLKPRLASIPGLEAVEASSHLPTGGAFQWRLEIEGQPPVEPEKRPEVDGLVIGRDYFRLLHVNLLRGRTFEDTDGLPGKTSVIASQAFVAKYWPGADPLGKRLRLVRDGEQPWLTVVGVAPDIRQNSPTRLEVDPVLYAPLRQDPLRSLAVIARGQVPSASLTAAIRKEVQAVDEDLPVYAVTSLDDFFSEQRWGFRVFGTIFGLLAAIALVLASVGIYAVMAYAVGQRTQEIGVRMALGASAGSILRLVMTQGLTRLTIGFAVGLAAALAVTRFIRTLLVQITPSDPLTFISVSAVLIGAGLLACWIPARRAMRVDPVIALRDE